MVRAQAIWSLGVLNATTHRDAIAKLATDRAVTHGVVVTTSTLPSDCAARQDRIAAFVKEALERLERRQR